MKPGSLFFLLLFVICDVVFAGWGRHKQGPGARIVLAADDCSGQLLLNRKLYARFFRALPQRTASSSPTIVPTALYHSLDRAARAEFVYLSQFSLVQNQPSRSRVIASVVNRYVGIWNSEGVLQAELQPPRPGLEVLSLDSSEVSNEVSVAWSTIELDGPPELHIANYDLNAAMNLQTSWIISGSPNLVRIFTSARVVWAYDRTEHRLRSYTFHQELKKQFELDLSQLLAGDRVTDLQIGGLPDSDGAYLLRVSTQSGCEVGLLIHTHGHVDLMYCDLP